MRFIHLLFASLLISYSLSSPKIPTIAIYAHPEPYDSEFYTADIVNSNSVRWLESAGADAVVIHPWHEHSEIDEILSKVNGVLFQAGERELNLKNRWEKNANYILEKVKKINENGEYFPLLGVGQGFELIHALVVDTLDVLSDFAANEISDPLIPSPDFDVSRMFADITKDEKLMIQEENIAAQFHKKGVRLDTYFKHRDLDKFFNVTTYAQDKNGHVFVDTVEAKDYPIYATQHNPEKINFERRFQSIPTSLGAIIISQRIGQFFVDEARENANGITGADLIRFDYLDTMTNVKRNYYFQDAIPVMGENPDENSFLA